VGQSERDVVESSKWTIDLVTRELRANGVAVPIGSRAFEIIEALVRSDGEIVTKDALMRSAWPGAIIVEDGTIRVHISAIRKALGADRRLLQTVPGRGYRLLVEVIGRFSRIARRPTWIGLTEPGGRQLRF
jgi:non-specific serine/threonine protein kinase